MTVHISEGRTLRSLYRNSFLIGVFSAALTHTRPTFSSVRSLQELVANIRSEWIAICHAKWVWLKGTMIGTLGLRDLRSQPSFASPASGGAVRHRRQTVEGGLFVHYRADKGMSSPYHGDLTTGVYL
ncbi:hypothetical protein K474DRAFT_1098465 [Panus rudis PR-1116 ss-1]|nr:hypothetical protein K474DRAFT_1098465 [Panus rudis PR-1116 ss-1]